MKRLLVGLGVGMVVLFAAMELIRFLLVQVFQLYDHLTVADAALCLIVVLLCILIAVMWPHAAKRPAPAMPGEQVVLRPRRPAPPRRRRPRPTSDQAAPTSRSRRSQRQPARTAEAPAPTPPRAPRPRRPARPTPDDEVPNVTPWTRRNSRRPPDR
jgi:hypothetical protein